MWILMIVGALVVLGVLGAVFVFFFVEFEDEYDEDLDEASAEEVDPYAWAKERQQQDAATAEVEQVAQPAVQQAATPAVSGYPGWKWDADQNKWIPDNE
jgi:flagellar basal body-associated protein FliL